jgi:hypothetical protein
MKTLPREVLERLAALPEGKPCRVVLNTNGAGAWSTETIIFDGCCSTTDLIVLDDVLHKDRQN